MRNLPPTMTRLGIEAGIAKGHKGCMLVEHFLRFMTKTYSNMADFTIKSIDQHPTDGWYYANIEYKQ